MQSATVLLLALVAVVAAEGQFYVPRAYYTIDAEGHASPPVPLRRLRRSVLPPYGGSSANANSEANAYGGGSANAIAIANAGAYGRGQGGAGAPGGWGLPSLANYGSSNPNLSPGLTRRQAGPILGGRSVVASSSVGLDSSGQGYYDQYTSVNN